MVAFLVSPRFREVEARLLAEGYRRGPPPHLRVENVLVDMETCHEATCEACGYEGGLCYEPYHKGDSYRALCVCPDCLAAAEF